MGNHQVAEDQASISKWAADTFGPCLSVSRSLARANEEMAEMVRELCGASVTAKAAQEAADVYICLYRAADAIGFDLRASERGVHNLPAKVPAIRLAGLVLQELSSAIGAIECDDLYRFNVESSLGRAAYYCRHIAAMAGRNIDEIVDEKMATNRNSHWRRDGTGCGYRIKPGAFVPANANLDAAAEAVCEAMGIAWDELPDTPDGPEWMMGSAMNPAKSSYRDLVTVAIEAAATPI